jgi:type I restriction-modification system DNA methylase subunit
MESKIMQECEKEFIDIFRSLCDSRSTWQVWADLMSAISCSLSNATDRRQPHYDNREKEYADCIKRLGSVGVVARIFAVIVNAYELRPNQDFLGKMYMFLELGNHWKGQFFTPYTVCELMARVSISDKQAEIKEKGYISVNDCACGAGALLIAAANMFREQGINYQNHVVFVAQDIDRVAGLMCYIQLSLLGCAGYVCIADTLTNPLCGSVLFPQEKEDQELWVTPMFASDVWQCRRIYHSMNSLVAREKNKDDFSFVFRFGEEGSDEVVCTLQTG